MWSSSSATGGPSKVRRQALDLQQPGDVLAHRGVEPGDPLRDPQGDEQAEADRVAVAPPPVSGGRLERMRERVPEVQRGPEAGVALVPRDDAQLGARAGLDHAGHGHRVALHHGSQRRQCRAPPPKGRRPAISAVFTISAKPAASSWGGSVQSTLGSVSTAAG